MGRVSLNAIYEAPSLDTPLSEILAPHVLRVSPVTPLEEVKRLLQEEEKRSFPLVEPIAIGIEGEQMWGYIRLEAIEKFLRAKGFEDALLPPFRRLFRLPFS